MKRSFLSLFTGYFSEFGILKHASREFWLTNAIQFCDGLAYFSMINVITLYLTTNCGFSDVDSGAWVGIFTLYITVFVFAVGAICDVIGIRRSFFIGMGLLALSRLGLGVVPSLSLDPNLLKPVSAVFAGWGLAPVAAYFQNETPTQLSIKALLISLALGTAFMSPVITTSLRRFTTKETRATGFNIYYLIMNIGAIIAGVVITDGFRHKFGEVTGNLAILDFGCILSLICIVCAYLMREHNYADESERISAEDQQRRPLAIFMEVWKESAFRKLILFLVLTIGVRLVFTHQFLVMPKYYTRVLYSDFDLGAANSINPTIIVLGLILLIPIINRFATIKLIVFGMMISALSLLFMCVPLSWIMALPWIHNVTQAYFFIIIAQILVFAVGELFFSPRFTEYIASVAPKDKVSSYMALSALPTFISKPINGFLSGLLVAKFSYEGIRAKIDTGNIDYGNSPEFMWLIYFGVAILSPFAVIALRRYISQAKVAKVPQKGIMIPEPGDAPGEAP